MPYALSKGGWLGLAALFIISIICMYTVMLLRYCMDFNPLIQSYPDIGQLAFGNKGRFIMALLMHIELYFVAIGLLVIEGDNISRIFPGVEVHIFGVIFEGKKVFILLSSLFVLPTTWPSNFRVLSYLSMASFLVFLFLLALILWIGEFQGVGFNQKGVILNWSQMPATLSIFIFSFGGHPIMPTIYSSMKDQKKFSKVLIIGFTICTVQYGLIAVIGYLMFGEETKSIVTLNLPKSLLTSKIAIWTVVLIPLVKYSLIIMPINISLEDRFQITGWPMSILIRTSVVFSTAIIAATVPCFAFLVGFTGALISGMVTIIMPCLCYLKIFKSSLKGRVKTPVILCIIGIGALISILGTYVSIRNFRKGL
ncbi:Lysine histidine transporter-like 3 [Dendrobium catenatum]|uniref:Lysine histidine transporter-like 3 n=1 Tax=Dendrobium catenatum TaxID=906689 RepID=A0A2I0WX64_9ASPA|nr:Lysine histidine transporter-like 3 [Dendrobium catenatum]